MVEIPGWLLFVLAVGLALMFLFDLYCLYVNPEKNRRELVRAVTFDSVLAAIVVPVAVYDTVRGSPTTTIAIDAVLAVLILTALTRRIQLLRRTYERPSPLLRHEKSA